MKFMKDMFFVHEARRRKPIEKFVRYLKKQATQCNFGDQHDSLIRDQIVFGTNNPKLRERMLAERGPTLLKAEQMCKAAEAAALRRLVWNRTEDSIDAVSSGETATKKQQQRKKKAESR